MRTPCQRLGTFWCSRFQFSVASLVIEGGVDYLVRYEDAKSNIAQRLGADWLASLISYMAQ